MTAGGHERAVGGQSFLERPALRGGNIGGMAVDSGGSAAALADRWQPDVPAWEDHMSFPTGFDDSWRPYPEAANRVEVKRAKRGCCKRVPS